MFRFNLLVSSLLFLAATSLLMVLGDEMRDVAEGDNVTLECRFNSKLISPGRANLYWSRTNTRDKDNVAIGETPLEQNYEIDYRPSEGRYDLKIYNSTYDRDNGKYECHAKESGSGKKLHSATIQLTVLLPPGPPKINPNEPSATEGRNLELTCSSYGGSPDPLIKWYRAGINQPLDSIVRLGGSRKNKTSAILSITPTRDDDATEYRCVVWNRALSDGVQLQSSVKLNVNYFPRVKVGPENPLRIEKGGSAKLSCHVDSKPAVSSVKWTRNGKFSETTFSYSIPRVTLSDAGTYVCSADNGLGQSGEADINLDVLYAPIVSVVSKKEYEEGENVWIKCNVSSNPKPVSVEWIKRDDPAFRQSGDLLRIERATAANVGNYICRATNIINPSGDVEPYERTGNASVSLFIKHAPGKTFIEPESPFVVEGAGITLNCGADPPGWPQPQYRWWREGSESTIAVGQQLNIGLAKASTEGTYFCQPNNEIGTGTVGHVELLVHQAPKIIAGLQSQVVRRTGDSGFSVMCSAVGKPRPNITWVKDGQMIDPSGVGALPSLYKVITEDIVGAKGFYTVQSTLYFNGDNRESIIANDRGYYACVFENDVKKEESYMYLRVQHKPIFQHKTGSDVERVAFDIGDTALVPCTVQAFPKPEFDWSFNSQLDSTNFDTNLTILSNELYISTLIIKNLREEHYGHYNCKTYNSMGNSSGVILLEKRGKPSPPSNLHVQSIQISSINLGYEPGFNGGYENTKYIISYYSDKNTKLLDFDCQSSNPCNVTGLEQQTIYVFKIKSYNDRGYSEYSPSVTNMTRIDVAKIPLPLDVKFEPKSATIVFNKQSNLPLKAKLESQNLDGSWRLLNTLVPIDSDSFRYVIEDRHHNIEQVRVSLCVGTEDSCGKSVVAKHIEVSELPAVATAGIRVHYVIGVVVSGIIFLLLLSLVIIFCCCRKKPKATKKIDYEAGRGHQTQVIPPPYFTNTNGGLENKALDRSVDIIEDTIKSFHAGNGYISYGNGGDGSNNGSNSGEIQNSGSGIPFIDQNSYSNSNNGGSVDSQDSLWKITHIANANNDQQQQLHLQQLQHQQQQLQSLHSHHNLQQQQLNHSHHLMNGSNYDPYPPSVQLIQQQQQQQNIHCHDDQSTSQYHPYDNRNSYVADPYAQIPKPKRRQDLNGEPISPYHELSGLPDPYMNNINMNNHHHSNIDQTSLMSQDDNSNSSSSRYNQQPLQYQQQNPQQQQQHHISFDESVDGGGYATPNSRGRRVIREIIV